MASMQEDEDKTNKPFELNTDENSSFTNYKIHSYQCSECGQSLKSQCGMAMHSSLKSNKWYDSCTIWLPKIETSVETPDSQDQYNSFPCSEFVQSFKSLSGMKQHRQKMPSAAEYQTSSTKNNKWDDSSSIWLPERETSIGTPDIQDQYNSFPCSECGQAFKSISDMKQHRQKMPSDAEYQTSSTKSNKWDDSSSIWLPERETAIGTPDIQGLTMEKKAQCSEHRKCINYVCTDHREALCDECLGIYHNQCSILDMTSALSSYEKLRQSLESMLKKELKQMQNVNYDLNQELSMRDEVINSIVNNLKKTYDDMKAQYIQTTKQNEDNLLSSLKELEERKMNMEKILDNVNDIQLNFTTIDNLLSMYKLKQLTVENIENFQKMCKKESLSKVNQNVDIIAAHSNKRLIACALYPIRENIYLNRSVSVLNSFPIKPYRKPNFIRGCTFASNDEMCFVDARNDRLVIAKSNGEQSSIPLPGRPFDVKNGGQGLIVTLRQNRSICFVEQVSVANPIISVEEVKFRDTGSIGGISRAGDHVIMAVECYGFYILDLNGEIKNKISIKDDINIQYVASTKSNIFYTKSDESLVYCCDHKGDTLWIFEDDKRMKTPTGITVDEDGCVYVSCLSSNNVLIISPDGQFGKELIPSIDRFKRIHAIDYNVSKKTLLICTENGDARVYKIQKSPLD